MFWKHQVGGRLLEEYCSKEIIALYMNLKSCIEFNEWPVATYNPRWVPAIAYAFYLKVSLGYKDPSLEFVSPLPVDYLLVYTFLSKSWHL